MITDYERQFNQIPQKSIDLARLQRARLSNEKLYLLVEEKFNEAAITETSEFGYVTIMDHAVVPKKPVSPNVPLNLIMGVIAGLGLGVVVVFARARMDTRLRTPEGRLLRSFNAGEAAIPAFLEDYAFYIWGLIELHQATLKEEFLTDALRLSREMLRLFGAPAGGLYDVGSDAEQLPVRMRSATDGVIPSGVSVAALNLLRLGRIGNDQELAEAGEALLRSHMGSVARQPSNHLFLLAAFDFTLGPQLELHLSGGTEAERETILRSVGRRFIPGLVVLDGEAEGPLHFGICANGTCRPPLSGVDELMQTLDELLSREQGISTDAP